MNLRRFARTATKLHPLQLAARAPNAILGRFVRVIPAGLPPHAIETWPKPHLALRNLANAERTRNAGRRIRLPAGRLRDYETFYGMELGSDDSVSRRDWRSPVAVEPYPASVRARRIAVAIRCGRRGLEGELARAARAVLLRPEVHLLGNHLLENGIALACAGAVASNSEADLWWVAGTGILAWQLPKQFLEDGGHVERSASYHVALTGALLETIELAEASGRNVPELWRQVAASAIGWASAVRAPDGTYPLFNDASLDGAPLIDDVLALGAALRIDVPPVAHVESSSGARIARLGATGWVRLDVDRACMFIDAGADADGWQPGHAHADGLTFELWVDGARAIVDFGVSSYEAGPARDETRATRSHNTAELGGADSCEVWDAFRVGRRGRGYLRSCNALDGAARIEVEHDGYAWRAGAPRHERWIELREGALEVFDRIRGGSEAWVSRLRIDAVDGARLRISGDRDVLRRTDRWYPRHGNARTAVVLEQSARANDATGVIWRVEW
jgi:hypothetical protein